MFSLVNLDWAAARAAVAGSDCERRRRRSGAGADWWLAMRCGCLARAKLLSADILCRDDARSGRRQSGSRHRAVQQADAGMGLRGGWACRILLAGRARAWCAQGLRHIRRSGNGEHDDGLQQQRICRQNGEQKTAGSKAKGKAALHGFIRLSGPVPRQAANADRLPRNPPTDCFCVVSCALQRPLRMGKGTSRAGKGDRRFKGRGSCLFP